MDMKNTIITGIIVVFAVLIVLYFPILAAVFFVIFIGVSAFSGREKFSQKMGKFLKKFFMDW